MKNLFQPESKAELIARLEKLSPDATPQWGKMNAAQMIAHCAVAYKVPTGEVKLQKLPFFLRLMGKLIKKSALGEKPYSKNSPTADEFVMTGKELNFEAEKRAFLEGLDKFAAGPQVVTNFDHAFFGKMTAEEWARHIYKHTDYHFGQFGI